LQTLQLFKSPSSSCSLHKFDKLQTKIDSTKRSENDKLTIEKNEKNKKATEA